MTKKETMISRERVLKALNHQTPDRVPIDFGGFQTGIHKRAYTELLDFLGIQPVRCYSSGHNRPEHGKLSHGLKDQITILDPVQQLARPCEEILERFRVDIRYVCAHGPDSFKACPERSRRGGIEQNIRDGKLWHDLKDEFGVIWSMPFDPAQARPEQGRGDRPNEQQPFDFAQGGELVEPLYMDISHHPLADAAIEDIADYPFPKGDDPTRFTGLRDEILQLRKETPYAISTGIGGVVYEICWYMRGLERWYMDMIENPAFCEALLDRILKFWLDYYTVFMAEVGDIIDIVMIGDDLAGQNGPLFSPNFYRKIVKPRQKRLVQHIKSLTKAKIWYHTCGSCWEYIPDLIDNGIDILNPVQIGLINMEPKKLKEKFGKQLVFWGGAIDAQHILPFAKPSEIREHVRRNLEIFKPGGGYVFNNVHNIQVGVPVENIVTLFDAGYDFGFYD
jgi:uroporphyrinogen decarboxylase